MAYATVGSIIGGLAGYPTYYPQQAQQWQPYPTGISETQSKHIHVDLALIDWKDITIIKGNQKITMTPEELAITLGLEW